MWIWISVGVLLLVLIVFTVWGNTTLKIKNYEIKSNEIPQAFSGFVIANVSDFHNSKFWSKKDRLINKLKRIEPSVIVITGDLIDARRVRIDRVVKLLTRAVDIAPVYFVSGNHELRISEEKYRALINGLDKIGVTVLDDKRINLEKNGQFIQIVGLKDHSFDNEKNKTEKVSANKIVSLYESNGYRILLTHRPDFLTAYAQAKVDLVLCGHTHGGQFRLPFIGGIIAPTQGLFPKYDAGLFVEDKTQMIISSGVGNSWFPFRFNNRPEIVVAHIVKE